MPMYFWRLQNSSMMTCNDEHLNNDLPITSLAFFLNYPKISFLSYITKHNVYSSSNALRPHAYILSGFWIK